MADGKQKKVLIVDDSDLVAGMLGSVLEENSFTVVRGKNGLEGVILAYKEIPDVIILDVEMPVMQGYQASRILRSRRGLKEIPIIMHTSLSEDRDRYWALNSGADLFVNKDFDNIDNLVEKVEELSDHPPLDEKTIREDGKNINESKVYEIMGELFDNQLFQSTILNMLGDAGRSIGSLTVTAYRILQLIDKICEADITVLTFIFNRIPFSYIRPGSEVVKSDVDGIKTVCLEDFAETFPGIDLSKIEERIFDIENRDDFDKIRIDEKNISSYTYFVLEGKGGASIGTLHVGNFINNYFSEKILNNLHIFAEGAGIILENSILFRQVTEIKDKIHNVFTKFVPQEIIEDLIEKKTVAEQLIGQKRKVVILFSDIRSFTKISENNSAESVVGFLNRYFNCMVETIKQQGGTIDKFLGDAILAIFGAPKSYEDNEERAVKAALQMIENLKTIETGNLSLPEGGFNIGIGVHSGEAIVGNIGSSDKLDYTVIGDTVNLASRLEGLTKNYGQRLIISEAVENKLSENYFIRLIDTVKVKGKTKPTNLFSVEADGSNYHEEFFGVYQKAIKSYQMGNWTTAVEYLSEAATLAPDDRVVDILLDRCREFEKDPPKQWDGAIALQTK
jgi:adenylate cyclase